MKKNRIVVAAALTLTLYLMPRGALACTPVNSTDVVIVQEDAPSCIQLGVSGPYARLAVKNDCDDTFELTVDACGSCSAKELTVPPGETASLSLGENPTDEAQAQSFSWALADASGSIETETAPTVYGSCDEGCSVANAPRSPWSWLPLFAAFLGLWRRPRTGNCATKP